MFRSLGALGEVSVGLRMRLNHRMMSRYYVYNHYSTGIYCTYGSETYMEATIGFGL